MIPEPGYLFLQVWEVFSHNFIFFFFNPFLSSPPVNISVLDLIPEVPYSHLKKNFIFAILVG